MNPIVAGALIGGAACLARAALVWWAISAPLPPRRGIPMRDLRDTAPTLVVREGP